MSTIAAGLEIRASGFTVLVLPEGPAIEKDLIALVARMDAARESGAEPDCPHWLPRLSERE
jgi:hypothetical protein